MIDKKDIILLLTELQEKGVDVSKELNDSFNSDQISIEALKKINDNTHIDVIKFYEKLRLSYNAKKSKLYINILRSDENTMLDPRTVLTTLSALLNQILQFKADNKVLFYKHSRADEITKVLAYYFNHYDIEPAAKLLTLFKADIVCLEFVDGRRNISNLAKSDA